MDYYKLDKMIVLTFDYVVNYNGKKVKNICEQIVDQCMMMMLTLVKCRSYYGFALESRG